jgi:hypothetical protein
MGETKRMATVLKAGATYFAIVYFFGFMLGTVRVLLLAPRIGEVSAVLLETPIVLAASWIACRWCTGRFVVPHEAGPRLAMGGVAFALLIVGEVGVSMLAFGRSWGDTVAATLSPSGLIGLSAQAIFALLPLVQAIAPASGTRPTREPPETT